MTEDEYKTAITALLKRLGGSYEAPSGFLEDGLSFSCVFPPIEIPNPSTLTPEQRQVLINRFNKRFPPTQII
jgi:hypothetical protein